MAMRSHLASAEHAHVNQVPDLYSIRISGQLGPMALGAFPSMVAQVKAPDTLLTGIRDRSALYGVLAVGKSIVTIEGASGPVVEAVRDAWYRGNVVQCGYC